MSSILVHDGENVETCWRWIEKRPLWIKAREGDGVGVGICFEGKEAWERSSLRKVGALCADSLL